MFASKPMNTGPTPIPLNRSGGEEGQAAPALALGDVFKQEENLSSF